MAMLRKDLGEALLTKGLITPEQLSQARDVQRSAPGDIGRIIVDLEFAPDKAVTEVRAETLGLPFVDLNKSRIDPTAVNSIPEHIAKRHKILPIGKQGNKLIIASSDYPDPVAQQDIRLASGAQQIAVTLATEDDIIDATDRMYKSNGGSDATEVMPASSMGGINPNSPLAKGDGGGGAGGLMSADLRHADRGLWREAGNLRRRYRKPRQSRRGSAYRANRLRNSPAGDQGRGQRHPYRAGPPRDQGTV